MRIQLIGAALVHLRNEPVLVGDIVEVPADVAALALAQTGVWRVVDETQPEPAPAVLVAAVQPKEDVHVHTPGDAGQPSTGRRAGGKRRA